jgi:hypothetical protein
MKAVYAVLTDGRNYVVLSTAQAERISSVNPDWGGWMVCCEPRETREAAEADMDALIAQEPGMGRVESQRLMSDYNEWLAEMEAEDRE